MSPRAYWVALAMVALGTLLFRLVFLGSKHSPSLPPILKRAMDFVPTAVLAALVIPQFVRLPNPDWPVLGSGIVAALAAWFLKPDILALVVGFVAYGLFRLLLG